MKEATVGLAATNVRKLEKLGQAMGEGDMGRTISRLIDEEFNRRELSLQPLPPPQLSALEFSGESDRTEWNPPIVLDQGATAVVNRGDGGRVEIVYRSRAEIEAERLNTKFETRGVEGDGLLRLDAPLPLHFRGKRFSALLIFEAGQWRRE